MTLKYFSKKLQSAVSPRVPLAVFFLALCSPGIAAESRPPNIILILADDLGYSDVGYAGCGDIWTPHLDSLAREGTVFTDAYVTAPICVPSRMGIMMGRYQERWGVYNNEGGYWPEGQRRTAAETTVAEFLQAAGYATALFGKWHLCGNGGKSDQVNVASPERNGFDEVEVIFGGSASYWTGTPLYQAGSKTVKAPKYLTDHFGNLAVDFVRRHREEPFFLALAFNAVHAPLNALEKDSATNGEITNMDRRTYAGMVTALDRNIGHVLEAVSANGLAENTLVAFLSDNGGPAPDAAAHSRTMANNGRFRGFKFDVWEGGIRTPLVMKWPTHIPAGKLFAGLTSSMDLAATFLAAAGVPFPVEHPLDGVNLLPMLSGENVGSPHDELFWECRWYPKPDCAARVGKWKIVQLETGPEGPIASKWLLFDLNEDPGEQCDLSGQYPDRVREMDKKFRVWRNQMAPPLSPSTKTGNKTVAQ